METVGMFYDPLVNFMAIWYILWSFGIFFPRLVMLHEKIWQPCFQPFIVPKNKTYVCAFEQGDMWI
jgi:hypothetical protein